MPHTKSNKLEDNIFLLIERYLVDPSKALEEKIKHTSEALSHDAYSQAGKQFPGKKIGADEWHPILLQKIGLLAKAAAPYSARLVANSNITQSDPAFIFKLSQQQQEELHKLLGRLLDTPKLHADGFIFAYDAYIERNKESRLTYCDQNEALTYDHNSRLYLQAQNLAARGHDNVAKILSEAASNIKGTLQSNLPNRGKNISQILEKAKDNPEVLAHRGAKQAIVNFLLMISLVGAAYLAATAEKRGTFWYRPNTDTEKALNEFKNQIEPQK